MSASTCIAPATNLTGYKIHRCRCEGCTAANRAYYAKRARLQAYGRWQSLVDAQPVREHVQNLRAYYSVPRIAELAQVGYATVNNLIWPHGGKPPTKRLYKRVADALLAVQPNPALIVDGRPIDSTGTQRRIQALATIGYPLAEQFRRIGRDRHLPTAILRQSQVTAQLARLVSKLYDELSATPAQGWTADRIRRWAQAQGWFPPGAWDDDTIDHPDAVPVLGDPAVEVPDEELVRKVLHGHAPIGDLNATEQTDLWLHWLRYRAEYGKDGPGVKDFARRYGVEENDATRIRNAAEGRTRKKTTTAASECRTNERKAA